MVLAALSTLADAPESTRIDAVSNFLSASTEHKEYSIERLIKGLASPRQYARSNFAIALASLLQQSPCPLSSLLPLSASLIMQTNAPQKDANIAHLLFIMAVCRANLIRQPSTTQKDIQTMFETLLSISSSKSYMLLSAHSLVISIFQQASGSHLDSKTASDSSLEQNSTDNSDAKKSKKSRQLDATPTSDPSTEPESNAGSPVETIAKTILKDGIVSPEQLWFAVIATAVNKNIDWKSILPGWHNGQPLHQNNLQKLVKILSAVPATMAPIHPIWQAIADTVLPPSSPSINPSNLSNFPTEQPKHESDPESISITQLWSEITPILFSSSVERKSIGFSILNNIVPRLSAQDVPLIFSKQILAIIISSLSNASSPLHSHASDLVATMIKAVQSTPSLALPILMTFQSRYGSIKFDAMTKTKLVQSCMAVLTSADMESYMKTLVNVFQTPSKYASLVQATASKDSNDDDEEVDNGSIGETESAEDKLRRMDHVRLWCITQLVSLVRTPSMHRTESLITSVIQFLIFHSFFSASDDGGAEQWRLETPLSDPIKTMLNDHLQSSLSVLSKMTSPSSNEKSSSRMKPGQRSDGTPWLYYACQYIQDVHGMKDVKCEVDVPDMSEFVQLVNDTMSMVSKIRQRITAVSSNSSTPNNRNAKKRDHDVKNNHAGSDEIMVSRLSAFESMLSSMIVTAHGDASYGVPVIRDIMTCYEEMVPVTTSTESKKRNKKTINKDDEGSDHPPPINVLTDTIISFMARSSTMLRTVATNVCMVFAKDMTQETVNLMCEVVEAAGGVQGARELFGNDENGDDEEDQDDDKEDDDDDDDEDVGEGLAPVDKNLRRKIREALGSAAVPENEDDSDAESDLTDSDMPAFDAKLTEIFRHRRDIKSAQKSLKNTVLHFKIRVLDLMDMVMRQVPQSSMVVDLITRLVKVVVKGGHSNDDRDVVAKCVSVITRATGSGNASGADKTKTVPVVDVETATQFMRDMNDMALRSAKAGTNATGVSDMCAKLMVYAVRVYHQSIAKTNDPETQDAKSPKRQKIQNGSASTHASTDDRKNVVIDAYMALYRDYMSKKNSGVKTQVFIELMKQCAVYGIDVVSRIMQETVSHDSEKPMSMNNALKSMDVVMNMVQSVLNSVMSTGMSSVSNGMAVTSMDSVTDVVKQFGTMIVFVMDAIKSSAASKTDDAGDDDEKKTNASMGSFARNKLKQVFKTVSSVYRIWTKCHQKHNANDSENGAVWDMQKVSVAVMGVGASDAFKSVPSIMVCAKQCVDALVQTSGSDAVDVSSISITVDKKEKKRNKKNKRVDDDEKADTENADTNQAESAEPAHDPSIMQTKRKRPRKNKPKKEENAETTA